MARKTARTRTSRATPGPRRTLPEEAGARPISTTGIDTIDAGDHEPGMPDALDLAETGQPMSPEAAKTVALAGGDLDAGFHGIDSGEEAVGGSDPLPDQNDVDQIGSALGVVEQNAKPLATTEKLLGRDEQRWELDPASAEDYAARQAEEAARRRRRQP
jgi:hypothetical protein